MRRVRSYLILAPLVLLVVACPLPTIPQAAPAHDTPVAVAMDAASGRAVLVMASGARLPIAATEADGSTVSAAQAAGMVVVPDDTSAKGMSGGRSAIIFGTRGDGKPGIWFYSGDQFEPVVDEDSGKATTALAESKDRDGAFRGAFGWVYHVVTASEDGKLLSGYAENPNGFTFHGVTVDPGTTIGVYWTVKRQTIRRGLILSRAHILGSLDPAKVADAGRRDRRLLSNAAGHTVAQLKLFLLGYYESYLVMVDANGTHVNAAGTLYSVSGTDQDGQPAVATIDASGKVTINELPPPPPPPPATPTGLTVSGATTSSLALGWDASTTGATSYQVYRDTAADGAFTAVAFDGSATSFTDSGLTPATTYYYKARATGTGGSSALSAVASGTTLSAGLTVRMAADVNTGAGSSNPNNLTVYNGALYFAATDTVNGAQLRSYDGSTLSTVSAISNFNPRFMTVFNGSLYMEGGSGASAALYSLNGSTLGPASPAVSKPAYMITANGKLYMSGFDAAHGQELWVDDGTTAGMVADIDTQNAGEGSFPAQLAALGTTLYFQANDGTGAGIQLFSSDGTARGTAMVAILTTGINAGADALPNSPIVAYGSSVYFPATADTLTYNLYSYSGSGTPAPVDTTIQASASAMVVYNGSLYLRATNGTDGYELYKYDGSTLTRVADINPGAGDGLAVGVTFGVYNNELYFGATDGVHGNQLYKYDGVGVTLVQTINPTGNANPGQFAVLNGKLYFSANDGVNGAELWNLY